MAIIFVAQSKLPTIWGEFKVYAFNDDVTQQEHLLLTLGNIDPKQACLTRVHSACLTGDALFSLRCDCGAQLHEALRLISCAGSGAIVYLAQEGRGIGLANKIHTYSLQDQGLDTVEANNKLNFTDDLREYKMCKDMLNYANIKAIKLLTNNPNKIDALTDIGIEVTQRISLRVGQNQYNAKYIQTKISKLKHIY